MPAVDKLNSDAVIPNNREPQVQSIDGVSRSRFSINNDDSVVVNIKNSSYIMVFASNLEQETEISFQVTIDDIFKRDEKGKPIKENGFDKVLNEECRWVDAVIDGVSLFDPSNFNDKCTMFRFDTKGISAVRFIGEQSSNVEITVRY